MPPSMRHKTSKRPAGWVEAGEKADGKGKGKMGGEEWLGSGRNKSNVDIHGDRMWEINERVGCDQHTWLS